MAETVDRVWVEELLRRNRYLVMSTTDGTQPWIAPLGYILDADLNCCFFSPENVRHSRHIAENRSVAAAVCDHQELDYSPGTSLTIKGIQIEATASKLVEAEYPEEIVSAIAALDPPMPPYAAYSGLAVDLKLVTARAAPGRPQLKATLDGPVFREVHES